MSTAPLFSKLIDCLEDRFMRSRKSYLSVIVLCSGLFWLSSCRPNNSVADKSTEPVKQGNAIVSETMEHFRAQTYSATVNISKVYKSGLRYDDVLQIYSKFDEQDHIRVLLSIKPQGERKGSALLAELRNQELVSAYRFIPEIKRVVTLNPKQRFSNVVIGGLSLEDLQMIEGVSPFSEVRVAGREEVNGKLCDALEVIFRDQSQYHHGQSFTTVADRLPVLLRAFDKEGVLIKELVFDKLEQVGSGWVVRQLTVVDRNFDYTSTFSFEKIQLNSLLEDSIFTVDFLQRGWQELPDKGRRS
jgi:Outer membrane lipoprotein-sorting protein